MGKSRSRKGRNVKTERTRAEQSQAAGASPQPPTAAPLVAADRQEDQKHGPDRQPQAERQEHPVPKNRHGQSDVVWGLGFTVIFPALFAIAFGFLIFFLQENPPRYNAALLCGFISLICLVVTCAIYIRRYYSTTDEPSPLPVSAPPAPALNTGESVKPFSIAVLFHFGWGHKRMEGWNWVTYHSGDGPVACPVSVALDIRVMNLKSVPSTVIAMRVEAKNHKDEWVKLSMMDVHSEGNELYYVVGKDGLKEAARMDMKALSFDYRIKQPLAPHELVSGWAFFSAPEEVKTWHGESVRIYLKDFAGVEMTEVLVIGSGMEDGVLPSDHFNYAGSTTEDISGYQLRYWNF